MSRYMAESNKDQSTNLIATCMKSLTHSFDYDILYIHQKSIRNSQENYHKKHIKMQASQGKIR